MPLNSAMFAGGPDEASVIPVDLCDILSSQLLPRVAFLGSRAVQSSIQVFDFAGALGEIRTPGPRNRNPMLYPAELRARAGRNSRDGGRLLPADLKSRGGQKQGCNRRSWPT